MAIETITMPQLGESVTEGTISRWLVSPGDHVNKYDPIAEVMTDKVNAEIPSSFTGTIAQLKAGEDQTLAVGEVICTIEVAGTMNNQPNKSSDDPINNKSRAETNQSVAKSNMGARYSPAVLHLSQEHNIDLTSVKGTGAGGRITRKDIMKLVENGVGEQISSSERKEIQQSPISSPIEEQPTITHSPTFTSQTGDVEVPITPVRKAIAANMLRSKQEIPHAWMMMEVDATNLVVLREKEKQNFKQKEGYNLTYFAFFVKAVAQALKEYPQINSTWAGDKIVQRHDINLNIAVATEDSLFVPVIKHADEKSIKGIAREITELSHKVRSGTLKAEEMQGGTFTVNNTGSFGSVQSMGIINHPQAAILQVEAIVKRPVIIDGMIAVRDMVNLCLSLDHRVLDGYVCGKFLARVKEIVESMSSEKTSIY
ncbi:dihydrolipoamide acetyltransferase family protein [Bacillus massiliigorillae]|uniref:dihydrolipoamide acetyltransferase family protein n=1 Tax=Bacillus massiliigorillae TaxID=1243664 RepID=UPI0003A2F084|nr:dihydrolipoamide acetyltransferase family protein [Bacillus massiliigorillae]